MKLIVHGEKIVKEYKKKENRGSVVALHEIDFSMIQGKITALIGPDGAGKTTFLRLVSGLLKPTSGTLDVLGLPIEGNEQEIQSRISYMPQKFGLYEDLTVMENMNLYADLHGISREERELRYPRLLDMTGLAPFTDRFAGKLSGGMKQKLSLACTLIRVPELLLLDEPTVGVDPLSRRELWAILKRLVREENISILVTTAYMDEAELCDFVYVIQSGHMIAQGTPPTLREVAQNRCYLVEVPERTVTRAWQALFLEDEKVVDAVPEGRGVRIICQKGVEAVYFEETYGLKAISVGARLEDAFMIYLRMWREQQEGNLSANLYVSGKEKNKRLPKERAGNSETHIEVRALKRQFGDFVAVDKVSFSVKKGEIFGLLGPNGAGKTTTFRMLCGLLPASSGELSVAGYNLRTASTKARAKIGYMAQKFSLYQNMSVLENLRFFGGVYGLSPEQLELRINESLAEFDLTEKVKDSAGDLPGGYKQRLSMAVSLLHKPEILFLDEPTSGIDPLARRDFWYKITDLAAEGTTIIVTTHFMEEAEYCDRIMIQDSGKLLALGTPAEIRTTYGKEGSGMNEVFIKIVELARNQR